MKTKTKSKTGIKKTILYTKLILCLLFFAAFILPSLHVEANSKKTVKISCGINKSLYLNESGEPEGYCSQYMEDLAKINNWSLEYVEASWTDSVKNLENGTIDILFPTQMTEERKNTMEFSTSIGGYQPIGLYARSDSDLCYDDFEGFDGAKVAVSKGTSNEAAMNQYARENNFTYEPVYLNTTEDKQKALEDGTVDLIVFSTLNDVDNGKVVAMLDYLPFYYCTKKSNTRLLKELNYGMNQMLIRHPDVVEDVFYNFMNKNISFAYTKEERQEIKNHGKIVVGVYEDTPPLFDVDKNGVKQGIYYDLIKRIQEISGLDVEIRVLDRKEYAFDYLNAGTIDFVLGSSDQALKYADKDGEAKGYVQSDGVMDYYSINITKTNYNKKQEDPMIFALTSGRRYWVNKLQKDYPDASFEYYQTSKDCLDAVQKGKADVTVLNSWEYNYQSKNQRYEDLMEWENSRTLSESVFVSLEDQNRLIRSVLDKAIEQISNAEKEAIITSNLNRSYSSYTLADHLYEMKETIALFGVAFLIMLVGICVYIIMRRKSLNILKDKNQQLEEANISKDLFLSRMSHELRTPLNAINGYATVIEQNLDTPAFDQKKARECLESILRATSYQLAIIGDLLDIQKIESGKMELVLNEVDSSSYMNNIVEMIKPEAMEKNINFIYERISTVNETYYIDGVRFQQVLLNLLHNAMKFTPRGGKVKMTAEVLDQDESSNTLKFVISDTGIGMSEDFQKNYLFHRFAQEYKGNTSPYEGCGTGLAISRDIIHLMGGEITCKSEQGVGSSFTVILTARHLDGKKKKSRKRVMPSYDLSGIRVLICEDNPMNQDMEKRLLERMQCEVEIAGDGQKGFDKFKNSSRGYFDIVLMDIRMPNMDGLEATRQIRALSIERADAAKIPILAVSANAFPEDVEKSMAAGMNEHLAKPVDVRVLYDRINKYCKNI